MITKNKTLESLVGNIYKTNDGFIAEADHILIVKDKFGYIEFLELETGVYKEIWYENLLKYYHKVA